MQDNIASSERTSEKSPSSSKKEENSNLLRMPFDIASCSLLTCKYIPG
jgi:hypothetical protein